jgi:hypothetical protein
MKGIRTFAFAAAGLLVAAGAVAQQQRPDSLERRLERIEQALARLEAKASAREGGGMMENCREMMKYGGMMGGMMGGQGMMGGGRPNEQWRKGEAGK